MKLKVLLTLKIYIEKFIAQGKMCFLFRTRTHGRMGRGTTVLSTYEVRALNEAAHTLRIDFYFFEDLIEETNLTKSILIDLVRISLDHELLRFNSI